jgi:hypothetical protein
MLKYLCESLSHCPSALIRRWPPVLESLKLSMAKGDARPSPANSIPTCRRKQP